MVPVFAGIQGTLTMSEKGEGQLGDGFTIGCLGKNAEGR